MTVTDELLQRVASGQEVLLVEVKRLRDSHGELSEEFQLHRRDDREDFKRVFDLMEKNREDRNNQFDKIIDSLIKRIDENRRLIDLTVTESNRAKGAGWVIIGIVAFLGTALITVLGVLASHWWAK